MEFRILGPLEVRVRGAAVVLGGPGQRAVLAALLLRANETASISYLAEAVWETPPATPASNLRSAAGDRALRGGDLAGAADFFDRKLRLWLRWRTAGPRERHQLACLLPSASLLVVGIVLDATNLVPLAWLAATGRCRSD